MLRARSAAFACTALCLCVVAHAQEKLTYGDIVGRLYDLECLANPPAAGERSGNWSSWDRGAKYDRQAGRYENWHANRDGGGFIRKEGADIVAAEMKGPGVIWRVWSALPKEGRIRIYIDGNEKPALALLREDGILLMVQGGHATLGAWTLRQALLDRNDRKTVLK